MISSQKIHVLILLTIIATALLIYASLVIFGTIGGDQFKTDDFFEFPDEVKNYLPRKLPPRSELVINLWNFGFNEDFRKYAVMNGFRCRFIANRTKQNESDVILFDFPLSNASSLQRGNQLWLLHFMRTPFTLQRHQEQLFANDFMYGFESVVSYRKSFGIHSPIAKFIPHNKTTDTIQLTDNKLYSVASIRVKCQQQQSSSSPFEKLRSFLTADIVVCETVECFEQLNKTYSFVLLEFSKYCDQFIPIEMYYLLSNHLVPIVFSNSAMREQMPRNSYIDLKNFETFEKLRTLLVMAWNRVKVMQSFHEWRNDYELLLLYSYEMRFTDQWFPYFCESLFASNSSLQEISPNVGQWFYKDEKCFEWSAVEIEFARLELDAERCPDVNTAYDNAVVPNLVHFVRFHKHQIDFPFYVVLKSVLKVEQTVVFIHSDKRLMGEYWQQLQNEYTNIYSLPIDLPEIGNRSFPGQFTERSLSNFYRIYVLLKYGGIYLHDDHILLQPIDRYRFYESSARYSESYDEVTPELLMANRKARILHYIWNIIANDELTNYVTFGDIYAKLDKQGVNISRLVHQYSETFTSCETTIQWLFNYAAANKEWMAEAGIHFCRSVIDGVLGNKYGEYETIQTQFYSLNSQTVKTYNTTFGQIARYVLYNETEIN